jgi:hypothetical protein
MRVRFGIPSTRDLEFVSGACRSSFSPCGTRPPALRSRGLVSDAVVLSGEGAHSVAARGGVSVVLASGIPNSQSRVPRRLPLHANVLASWARVEPTPPSFSTHCAVRGGHTIVPVMYRWSWSVGAQVCKQNCVAATRSTRHIPTHFAHTRALAHLICCATTYCVSAYVHFGPVRSGNSDSRSKCVVPAPPLHETCPRTLRTRTGFGGLTDAPFARCTRCDGGNEPSADSS